ncbi:MAG: type II secretion system minor pseudopilin GspH [Wenzhouxiangellaceae bacterium]|nr:type II secretion system minor pseudopilin GspH [Wenzhouxiangellaceae bacterium]
MPKSATGASRLSPVARRPGGFTLIEILVVVMIAGILTGVVLLRLPAFGATQELQRELDRLQASLEVLCDQALLTGTARGLRFHAEGYDFWQRTGGTWKLRPTDRRPRPVQWPVQVQHRVLVDQQRLPTSGSPAPQVICSALEPATPFEIQLRMAGDQQSLAWPQ